MKRTVKDLVNLKGKVVLLRVDFNCPVDTLGRVTDYTRIIEALPTIKYLIKQGAKVVIMSHLGRPDGYEVRMSLWTVSLILMQKLNSKVYFSNKVIGPEVRERIRSMNNGDVLLLENFRFFKEERACDMAFCRELAGMADIYVNDAFGCAHRKHASTYGLARVLPNAIGLLTEKEVSVIGGAMEEPKRPFVAIIGGAKVPDKIKILKRFIDKADTILIGGAMAYTFLLAKGVTVGDSVTYLDSVSVAKEVLQLAQEKGKKILLPIDHVVVRKNDKRQKKIVTENLAEGMVGMDIGPKTVKLYAEEIKKAQQIIWNGPVGKFEDEKFREGTLKIAQAVAQSKAFSIVGGGDSVSAIKACKCEDKINFLSTGGGATLKFIEDGSLPCIDVIQEKIR